MFFSDLFVVSIEITEKVFAMFFFLIGFLDDMSALLLWESTFSSFFALLLGALVCWFLLNLIISRLRKNFLDFPNYRSSHSSPTPRGGGIAFVLVSSFGCLIYSLFDGGLTVSFVQGLNGSVLIALPIALVGYLDDRFGLPVGLRYLAQLCTACCVVISSPLIYFSPAVILSFLPLVISVTAIINFTNFMDGLDGLVAGCMSVSLSVAAIQLSSPWAIWVLVGALLGFLVWNWSPAKVFMGDVGSTFLGSVFVTLVLRASSWPEALGLLLVATPLLADACLCVPRRLIAGQRVFQAHRLHLFQRLHQAGWTHARVSSIYIAATLSLAIAFLWGGLAWVITLSVFVLLMGIWLDQQLAVPFALASNN